MATSATLTPWQNAISKFGITASGLAGLMGRHRSKVTRAVKDAEGLISARDQVLLLAVAKELNVALTPADLMPAAR